MQYGHPTRDRLSILVTTHLRQVAAQTPPLSVPVEAVPRRWSHWCLLGDEPL